LPIIRDGELYIMSHSPEQTLRLGAKLGKLLEPGDIVCLSGQMGAGKTLFSQGIGHGWGAGERITSPTYNLVHQHRHPETGQLLCHLDCYRLNDASDTESIGLDDMLDGDVILLIEWPEKIFELLPEDRLWIEIKANEVTRRNLMLEGHGPRYRQMIDTYRDQTFGKK
jgi:tRNA threonylcarbamoyladenosine biosynthesis protein TsaE